MRYYELKYGCDNKEVGTQFPQVWDFVKGYSPEVEVSTVLVGIYPIPVAQLDPVQI